MRIAKGLAMTFLSFAASGAGTAFGFGVVTIGILVVDKKLGLHKHNKCDSATIEPVKDELNSTETPTTA